MRRWVLISLAAVVLVFVAGAAATVVTSPWATCCGLNAGYNYFDDSGAISNEVAQIAQQDVPYPLAQVNASGGFLERQNLVKRLITLNNPHLIGYVYILSLTGKPTGYYTIDGKVSSTESQLTEAQQEEAADGGADVIDSIGDDGTWGPEEGGESGVFFFTTTGILVETDMPFEYTDAPLPLNVPSLNPTTRPKYSKR